MRLSHQAPGRDWALAEITPPALRWARICARWTCAAALCLVVALAPGAVRADFSAGLKAYDAGDYATAAREWRRDADKGDLAAQRNLGHLYRWGKGVEQDLAQAARWYRRAAVAGFDRAQINLALLHLNGQGVKLDEAEGVRWLTRAADAGNPEAWFRLGQLFEMGKGVALDRAKAFAFYGLAARAGHKDAQLRLASEPGGLEKLRRLKNSAVPIKTSPVKTSVSYVAKAEAPARDKTTALGDYLARRVTERLSPPAPKAPVPSKVADDGAVAAHLASYKQPGRARVGWERLARIEGGLGELSRRVRRVDIPGRGRFYRLYAVGDAAKLERLCESLVSKDKYCVLRQIDPTN